MAVNLNKALITGANGMVGSSFNFGHKLTRTDLDITNIDSCKKAFRKIKPELVIHLAALVDMVKCENDPIEAYRVNALGTYNIASLSKEFSAKMVYFSSGAVFGSENKDSYGENDIPRPLNIYGRTKLAGEFIIQDIVKNYLIVRTGWLFGGGKERDKKFVSKIISQIKEGKEVKAVSDRFGSPTYVKDLAGEVKKLIKKDARGIFHIVNSGKTSYYGWAKEIIKILNVTNKISESHANDFDEIVSRPKSENLLSLKLKELRPWQDALEDYLKSEWEKF